jgi:pyruvate-formate lyase/deferrochelatase/peroxidase EfeB
MEANDYALKFSQIGLPDLTRNMIFFTCHLTPGALTEERTLDVYTRLKKLAGELQARSRVDTPREVVITGVDLALWESWSRLSRPRRPTPIAFGKGNVENIQQLLTTAPPYYRSGGQLYFHIKTDGAERGEALKEHIRESLADLIESTEVTRGNPYREGHVYGRRILHGLIRSVDPVNLSARVITGDEDPEHKGACYCLTQRFLHNWEAIGRMSEASIEDMIGRDHHGNLIPGDYERSHLKRSRVLNEQGLNYRILTQGQPFGNEPSGHARETGVYVSAYAQSLQAFHAVLESMLGPDEGFIMDEHFTVSASDQGNIWYVPSAKELGLPPAAEAPAVPINPFFETRSSNGFMYYNTKDYLHNWGRQPAACNHPLSPRIMELLGNLFSRWHNKWYFPELYPDLGHLRDFLSPEEFKCCSIPERKGLSIKFMLAKQLTGELGREAGVFRIDPKEVIVGVIPPFTLGTGIRVMRYLTEPELLDAYFMALDETSMAGHIVPSYRNLTSKGVGALLAEARTGVKKTESEDQRRFYQSAVYALEGVQAWFTNHATLARKLHDEIPESQTLERENLAGIAARMEKLAKAAPDTFIEAVQLVFGVHCCLHLIGELTSLGRLDQTLGPFFEADHLSLEEAQEIIDALWIKMEEQVMMNRQVFPDDRTYGTCAVPYRGGANVPQGDKASQWAMQVTVGGCPPNDEPDPGDGCNEVTRLCLRASRRLPFNAPCLSLRISSRTPDDIVQEAARGILSGGADPYFFHDDAVAQSLADFGTPIPLNDARDYCADGCWEPIIEGKSEFALTYVPVLNALEATLNRGAAYITAGPTFLRGDNISYQTPPAEEIATFEEFMEIFYRHYQWLAASAINNFVTHYGNLWKVCPSPLLSVLMEDCLASGRDLTNGGARYHLLAPMILGVPCAIDSLWAIQRMVYDPTTAVTTLPELRDCLLCDWGHDMIEPLQNSEAGKLRADLKRQRYIQLRHFTLDLPKFGSCHEAVDAFGGAVARRLGKIFMDILEKPAETVSPAFAGRLEDLKQIYDRPDHPFAFKLTAGYGTFEDYLGMGLGAGASADGRRKGATLSSNMSPMPSPSDQPPDRRPRSIIQALKGYSSPAFEYARNIFAPVDIDIPEDFSEEALVAAIKAFGRAELGFNILSISCCDLETMQRALEFPEQYDLIRQRMGGWNEFFVTMFPAHQQQHMRRPLFVEND